MASAGAVRSLPCCGRGTLKWPKEPKHDELNALDFDTSRHYPRLPLFDDREVD